MENIKPEQNENVSSIEFFDGGVRLDIKGHKVEILGEIHQGPRPPRGAIHTKFIESSGTIDGLELSNRDLAEIMNKFGQYIIDNAGAEMEKVLERQAAESERQGELREVAKNAVEEVLA